MLAPDRHLECIDGRSERSGRDACHPMILRLNASITNATYTKAVHIATCVRAATCSWFGWVSLMSRSTSSAARTIDSSEGVVLPYPYRYLPRHGVETIDGGEEPGPEVVGTAHLRAVPVPPVGATGDSHGVCESQ